jgi:hypothetical protein
MIRVQVANPRPARVKKRRTKRKGSEMAKKRRRRARKKSTNPTRKRAGAKRRHKRTAAANPKRRRAKRRVRRASAANPRRRSRARRANPKRRVRRSSARRARANPARRRGKRRHKRNPGIPTWAMAGLAAAAGLVTYAVGQAGSFALTQRLDPSRSTLDRNRYIGFGLLTAAGLALAAFTKHPMLGAGVTAGGLMGLGGTELSLAIGKVIDKTEGPPQKLAGVFDQSGHRQFGAVFQGGRQMLGMGAVFDRGRQTFQGFPVEEFGG